MTDFTDTIQRKARSPVSWFAVAGVVLPVITAILLAFAGWVYSVAKASGENDVKHDEQITSMNTTIESRSQAVGEVDVIKRDYVHLSNSVDDIKHDIDQIQGTQAQQTILLNRIIERLEHD